MEGTFAGALPCSGNRSPPPAPALPLRTPPHRRPQGPRPLQGPFFTAIENRSRLPYALCLFSVRNTPYLPVYLPAFPHHDVSSVVRQGCRRLRFATGSLLRVENSAWDREGIRQTLFPTFSSDFPAGHGFLRLWAAAAPHTRHPPAWTHPEAAAGRGSTTKLKDGTGKTH